MRPGFKRSACMETYWPTLKPGAAALAATERRLQNFLNCSTLQKFSYKPIDTTGRAQTATPPKKSTEKKVLGTAQSSLPKMELETPYPARLHPVNPVNPVKKFLPLPISQSNLINPNDPQNRL
jgi:hypothetical protein